MTQKREKRYWDDSGSIAVRVSRKRAAAIVARVECAMCLARIGKRCGSLHVGSVHDQRFVSFFHCLRADEVRAAKARA